MGFYVRMSDASDIGTSYTEFKGELDASIASLQGAIGSLGALNSFSGQGADSVKLYFLEVHGRLLAALADLLEDLFQAYMTVYWPELRNAANQDVTAKFSEDIMRKRIEDFEDLVNNHVPRINSPLHEAESVAPSGYRFERPSTDGFAQPLRDGIAPIRECIEKINQAEQKGLARLGSGNYEAMFTTISTVLGNCGANGAVPMGSYQAGAFSKFMEENSLDLDGLAEEMESEHDQFRETAIENSLTCAQAQIENDSKFISDTERDRSAFEAGAYISLAAAAMLAVASGSYAKGASSTLGIAQRVNRRNYKNEYGSESEAPYDETLDTIVDFLEIADSDPASLAINASSYLIASSYDTNEANAVFDLGSTFSNETLNRMLSKGRAKTGSLSAATGIVALDYSTSVNDDKVAQYDINAARYSSDKAKQEEYLASTSNRIGQPFERATQPYRAFACA